MIRSGSTTQVRSGTVVGSYGDDDKVREVIYIGALECTDQSLTRCSSPEPNSVC